MYMLLQWKAWRYASQLKRETHRNEGIRRELEEALQYDHEKAEDEMYQEVLSEALDIEQELIKKRMRQWLAERMENADFADVMYE